MIYDRFAVFLVYFHNLSQTLISNPHLHPQLIATMLKVLYIGYVWPEPQSSAAGSRTMEFLRLFRRQHWQVIFASPAALSEHRADLSHDGIQEKSIVINCDSFDIFVQEYQPDIVMFDRFFTEEQFGWRVEKNCPQALRIIDTCDLHSLREARYQQLKDARAGMQKESERQALPVLDMDEKTLYSLMANSDIAQREMAALYRSDWNLITSPFEMHILQIYFSMPADLLHACNLMLVPVADQQSLPAFEQRQDFISIGNFRHAPNWDAVLWLKHAIWPLVRQQLPQANLHIVGAYPPPKAMELHQPKDGFIVKGWVDNAQQSMMQARVCLAPLRFGAGLKGKLFDAMTCGTPSVTTNIGSEGMHLQGQAWAGAIGQNAVAIANAAVTLYKDQTQWQQAQNNGFTIVDKVFQRETTNQLILEQLTIALEQKNMRRMRNFTGAMLRHHLHKSTQYMSQWIAHKNKM